MNPSTDQMEPERLLSFRWPRDAVDPCVDDAKEPTTLAVFEFNYAGNGTLLSVVESGFDSLPAPRRAEASRMNSGGWDGQMKNIEKHVAKA